MDATRDVTGIHLAAFGLAVDFALLSSCLDTPPILSLDHTSYLLKWVMMAAVFRIAGTSFGTSQKRNRLTKRTRLVPVGSSVPSPRYVPSFL